MLKYVPIKQGTLKQPLGQVKKSQRKLENTCRWINENTTWDAAEAMLRGKCVAVNASIKK